MPKLRSLSGKEVIKIFEHFDFEVAAQKGSHVKLKRVLGTRKQILTIPLHDEMDKGTLGGIYRQALHYISESELRERFYSE